MNLRREDKANISLYRFIDIFTCIQLVGDIYSRASVYVSHFHLAWGWQCYFSMQGPAICQEAEYWVELKQSVANSQGSQTTLVLPSELELHNSACKTLVLKRRVDDQGLTFGLLEKNKMWAWSLKFMFYRLFSPPQRLNKGHDSFSNLRYGCSSLPFPNHAKCLPIRSHEVIKLRFKINLVSIKDFLLKFNLAMVTA